jgi:acetylglutamate kinase
MLIRVIKIGGRVQSDPRLAGAIAAAWKDSGGGLVVVHGGGDEISTLQRAFGHEPVFSGGRRVTAAHDLDVLRMALSGSSNKRLVASLVSSGIPAVGLSGEDAGLITAARAIPATLGHVGAPSGVRVSLLHTLLRDGYMPVISPLARGEEDGAPLNVNGDDAASAIAIALRAADLLLVVDVDGVLDGASVVDSLDTDGARAMIAAGTAGGGMAAKLDAAIHAAQSGVMSVRIGGLDAIADPHGGTMITPAQVPA